MHLYFIRHGQSHVNLPEWAGGNTDEGLTELGQKQAAALATWLPDNLPTIDVLYCSTMLRAQETAAPLAKAYNLTPRLDTRLREIGNNRYDHQPWPSDDLPEYGDFWGTERPFSPITPIRTEGESTMHFRIRVGMFIEEMVEKHPEDTVVAICHGGVIEMAHHHIFNTGPWPRCEIWARNTGITRFQYVAHPKRETWRLHYHSRAEHLQAI